MKKILIDTLLWIWQLPQNLCGEIYRLVIKAGYTRQPIAHYESDKISKGDGVTLGEYIFTGKNASSSLCSHEFGHIIQSRMLGPLYLVVIGIPSLVHAAVHNKICGGKPYSHFYTEKWADKLSDKYLLK